MHACLDTETVAKYFVTLSSWLEDGAGLTGQGPAAFTGGLTH